MRILVTGASGLIGRALCLRLARDGVLVRAFIRQTGDETELQSAGVEVFHGDIRDRAASSQSLRGVTHVVHLAAQRAARAVNRETYVAVNRDATQSLALASIEAGVLRFVYGSTLGVHGYVRGIELDESSPLRPNSPYRESKLQGEEVLRQVAATRGLSIAIARISTVVGPRAMTWLPFVRSVSQERIGFIGGGGNHIDLVTLEDLVDGLSLCARVPNLRSDCFVLGGGEPWTFRAFTTAVAAAVGARPHTRNLPALPYRVLLNMADRLYYRTGHFSQFAHAREMFLIDKRSCSARAASELGYRNTRSIAAAIQAMVDWFVSRNLVATRRTT